MLATRLGFLLLDRGLSHEQAARLSGVSRATITLICEGKNENPRIRTLMALASALDVPVGYLAGEPNKKAAPPE